MKKRRYTKKKTVSYSVLNVMDSKFLNYKNIHELKQYTTSIGGISSREMNSSCSRKTQQKIQQAVKIARYLALIRDTK